MDFVRFKVTYYYKDEIAPRYAFFRKLEEAKQYKKMKSEDRHCHDFHIEKIKLK